MARRHLACVVTTNCKTMSRFVLLTTVIVATFQSSCVLALSLTTKALLWTRVDVLSTLSSIPTTLLLTPSLTTTSPPTRTVDVGVGGFDLLSPSSPTRLSQPDAFFPASMQGLWSCQRVVTDLQGDTFQARQVAKALGCAAADTLSVGTQESYPMRFVPSPPYTDQDKAKHNYLAGYAILDRAAEYAARSGVASSDISWQSGDNLHLLDHSLQLDVVWRTVELPSDKGFGSQELIKITTQRGGTPLRAALIKRRFVRQFDEQNNRLVLGLEVVQTFRVLDGVAGTEYPTSMVRSQLRLQRPTTTTTTTTGGGDDDNGLDVPSGAY